MGLKSSADSPQSLAVVVSALKTWVERCGSIWVDAQIIELRRRVGYATHFLTLRDRKENISATVTCSTLVLDSAGPLTEGAQIVALLKPKVFPTKTTLSFEAAQIQIRGEGKLLAELEQLKRLLQAEGLFDPVHKKRLPFLPNVIGLIAGKSSDAERDIRKNVANRWPAARIRMIPALVQGSQASESVIKALHQLDADPEISVIIIARGGGSLEDLLPFSNENLVREVAEAKTPIISAIGHEPDTPILDFVADRRASTPTEAAKIVVPDALEELELIKLGLTRIRTAVKNKLAVLEQNLSQLRSRPVLLDPMAAFVAHDEKIIDLSLRLNNAIKHCISEESIQINHILTRIRSLSPQATLERGYAILTHNRQPVSSVKDVQPKTQVKAFLSDGQLDLTVDKISNPH